MKAFFRRLFVGLVKGALLGALFGAAISYGLGWGRTEGLLAYLLAMGVGASVGLLAGKPPWAQNAWLEAILRAAGGLILGAFLYWLGTRFGNPPLPFPVGPGNPAGLPWLAVPLLYATAIGAVYGCLVELDNTGKAKKGGGGAEAPAKPAADASAKGGSSPSKVDASSTGTSKGDDGKKPSRPAAGAGGASSGDATKGASGAAGVSGKGRSPAEATPSPAR